MFKIKKINYKDLGRYFVEQVYNFFGEKNFGYLSENTDDWLDEIRHAEEYGHFEFNYKNQTLIINLEVKFVFDDEENVIDIEYYI